MNEMPSQDGLTIICRVVRCDSCQQNTGNRNSHPKKGIEIELRYKVAFRFATEDDLRFISHHDMMRLFEKALSRAQLPVKFSEGFNPRPKLSLPLPRPVGIASEADLLVVEFAEPIEPAEALRLLAKQMPANLILAQALAIQGKRTPQPRRVDYTMTLRSEDVTKAVDALQRLLAAETWPIQRQASAGKPVKTLDLRPCVIDASIADEVLQWSLQVSGGGSIRPGEFLTAIALNPAKYHHHLRRTAAAWDHLDESEESRNTAGDACP